MNSDPATWLLLHSLRDTTSIARNRAMRDVRAFMRAYPVGLFVDRLGPVVANDAYASPEVWQAFRKDLYHSPRVVWGREVNLFMLGLVREIVSSVDKAGHPRDAARVSYVNGMRDALRRTNAAVEASGLKHNELWSYEIAGGAAQPDSLRSGDRHPALERHRSRGAVRVGAAPARVKSDHFSLSGPR